MRSQLLYIAKLILIFYIFFQFQRLLFIFHFFSEFEGHYLAMLATPFQGFWLDLSAICYFTLLALLISVAGFFIEEGKWLDRLNKVLRIYVWVIFTVAALIMAGEIVTYGEWKTKLSTKIFLHFSTPSEIFRTASVLNTVWFLLYTGIQLGFAYLLFNRWFKGNVLTEWITDGWKRIAGAFLYLCLFGGFFVLGIRGGLQEIPVSATDAYFSDKQIVNDLSVNAEWNFLNTCYLYFESDMDRFFQNLDPVEAEQIVDEMFAMKDIPVGLPSESPIILTTDRPNIVLITLEGWSTQMVGPLGGKEDITPHFNRLCEEGLLFTQIYSTGGTSETGHSSIISGYPTISGISISTESAKCRKLPSLNKTLAEQGYNSLYAFGGSLSYGNIGGYLRDVGFDQLIDENDLDLEPSGKLGLHDEAMFPWFLTEIQSAERPYFYGLFTQSSHPPYDIPDDPFDGYDGDPFVSSMNYADKHLNKFVNGLRYIEDYDNTLVILIADHSRANVFNNDIYNEGFYHVPLLLWGGALKEEYRGKQIHKLGSQADLAKTVLGQMGLPTKDYIWSKDLLHPGTKEWAICTSTISYGLIDQNGMTNYLMIDDRIVYSSHTSKLQEYAIKRCRAILESMYREYEAF